MSAGIGAVIGVITLLVFSEVWAALNKANISAGAESLVDVIPIVLAAVIIIGVVMYITVRG